MIPTSLPVAPELINSSAVDPELIQDNLKSVTVYDTSLPVAPELIISSAVDPELFQDPDPDFLTIVT
jgi:hypothetical protein